MKGIRETFNKSALVGFKKFCQSVPSCREWLVASDYVFADKNRRYDTMAFALIPAVKDLVALRDEIENAEAKDLKKRRKIRKKFIDLLKYNKMFCVVLTFEKSYLIGIDSTDELENMEKILQSIEGVFSSMEQLTADVQQKNQIGLARLSVGLIRGELVNGMPKAKVSLVRELLTLVNITGFLVSIIHSVGGAKLVSLLPDRDPISNLVGTGSEAYFPQMMLIMANAFVSAYCEGSGYVDVICTEPPVSGAVWSDPFNRIADYFAGSFARLEKGKIMQDKVLHKLIAEYGYQADRVVVLHVGNTSVSRYCFNILSS